MDFWSWGGVLPGGLLASRLAGWLDPWVEHGWVAGFNHFHLIFAISKGNPIFEHQKTEVAQSSDSGLSVPAWLDGWIQSFPFNSCDFKGKPNI